MRRIPLILLLAGCAGESSGPESSGAADGAVATPDACCSAPADADPGAGDAAVADAAQPPAPDPDGAVAPPADAGEPAADAAPAPADAAVEPPRDQVIAGGEVAGRWCGTITVQDTVTVPAGQTLTLCAGTDVVFQGSAASALVVAGTLEVAGTAEQGVTFSGTWRGLRVGGELSGRHLHIAGASLAVEGAPGSRIRLDHAVIEESAQTLQLSNGGQFTYTTLLGGGTVAVRGGVLEMTDSTIDLQHPTRSPDCTDFDGGGAVLDHVRFTGCHCPLHINQAPEGVRVTNSIFDGAANPVMIAQTQADLRGNHFEGTDAHLLDIGGGFRADITGSYFGGGAPRLASRNLGQFVGADAFSPSPLPGVGPRP